MEYAKIDLKACSQYYRGADPAYNPFLFNSYNEDIARSQWFGSPEIETHTGIETYMRHGSALEGARGCMRECYVHLEKTGRLTKKFTSPFRKRPPWKIDREATKDILVGQKKSNDKTLL